ncbi:TPR-like protein [Cucurbitaria berberidis CBS 394.84]|uniref:TPR-like protein n=1 Tax=Cucurbitaria berberidis CBS 394.84 TaxID=1168544 RepID=A0A9P4GKX5_9PLEO|nr:TPR-like protein [Cucurbitaria berberidis CBS 394.84]KAF1847231.1 TPR-like protein [Cucurbitaria berberidis CBS 394.84]
MFDAFINEIVILGESTVREEPAVVKLQGITWDILRDDELWPALVFEKADHGDLEDFLVGEEGRKLHTLTRVRICQQIAYSVSRLHQSGVVHGDIKPANVLICKSQLGNPQAQPDSSLWVAKMTDFGYSARFQSEEQTVKLEGRSKPWDAPELTLGQRVIPKDARKTDIFSLGMLCLWTLYERYLSGIDQLPEDVALFVKECLPEAPGKNHSKIFLEKLKSNGKLIAFATLLLVHQDSAHRERAMMEQFFQSSLQRNPDDRLSELDPAKLELCEPTEDEISMVDGTFWPFGMKNNGHDSIDTSNFQFQIEKSVVGLYRADYRVRSGIRKELERKYTRTLSKDVAFQLALCYILGFGGDYNEAESQRFLHESEKSPKELQLALKDIHAWEERVDDRPGDIYTHLTTRNHIQVIDLPIMFRDLGKLEDAKTATVQELHDLQRNSGGNSRATVLLTHSLCSILSAEGKWKQLQDLSSEVILDIQNKLIPEVQVLQLGFTIFLVLAYKNLGLWDEAADLQSQVLRINTQYYGADHQTTIISMDQLALIYADQEHWDVAERLQRQAIGMMEQNFGRKNRRTLNAMNNLSMTYRGQGKLKEAESLAREVYRNRMELLGSDHPETLVTIGIIASILADQERLVEAEALERMIFQTQKKTLGPDHVDTLITMSNLSSRCLDLGDVEVAEALGKEALEIQKRVLGVEHPDTLVTMNNLSSVYSEQGNIDLAESLLQELLEVRKKTLGLPHVDTLMTMSNLASIYTSQQRLDEAESLFREVLALKQEIVGQEHGQTFLGMENLGVVLMMQGKPEKLKEAEELQNKVLTSKTKAFGVENLSTLLTMENLAVTYYTQGRATDAIELLEECRRLREKLLGADHAKTIITSLKLMEWQAEMSMESMNVVD